MNSLAATPTAGTVQATHPTSHKKTSHLLNNQRLIALSYAMDGLALLLFHLAGTISWAPALIYTTMGLSVCGVMALLMGSGWTQRFKDPGITITMSLTNTSVQLVAMHMFPEVSFMFALILFIVYGSMAMQLPVRQSIVAWVLLGIGSGLVLGWSDARMRIPDRTLAEQALAAGFFALTMWRCVWLGAYNKSMASLLKKRSAELAALTAQVEHLAHHDELTGLLNRRSLMTALQEEQQRADRQHSPLCVGIFDLDKFKSVNDTLGHLAGDTTLKIFATTIARQTRKTDRVGRYGGEEFLLIMHNTSESTALLPVDRMREALKAADWSAVAPGFSITFSCGIATYEAGESIEALIARADEALYRAKREGRNCTRVG